ncbi:MAG: glyoxalase/bleomycin resistance protein/dioxygenase superfamily protein 7 [Bradyrhizobium sp.]|nr:glyoxalase/bleomycin resistance protein/dioxygenase superfamily protein 7 [Bradyrhizobium sp.]
MSFRLSEKKNPVFEVKGLSHVALVSADMQRTVDFYQGVLGFPLIKTTELPHGGGQHFFFDMGDGQSSLAFFWFPVTHAVEPGITVPKNNIGDVTGAGDPQNFTTAIGSLNHIAFNVEPELVPVYKKKLEDLGIWVSPIMYHYEIEHGIGPEPDDTLWLTSVYFRDPDGIQLEFGGWSRRFTDGDIRLKPATSSDAPPPVAQLHSAHEAA